MTVEQKKIAHKDIILLDMGEVMEITGWCEKVVRNLFAYDEDFPAIKIGKKYQVEIGAFKEYLSKRRTQKENKL